MLFKVLKHVGKFHPGVFVEDTDFTDGRVDELVAAGVLEPHDGDYAAPQNDDDAQGWKRRAQHLEEENAQLRTATDGPAQEAAIMDLKKTVEALEAENTQLRTLNTELHERAVPIGTHQNVCDQLEQLQTLHKSTVAELDKLKGADVKSEGKKADEPDKAEPDKSAKSTKATKDG